MTRAALLLSNEAYIYTNKAPDNASKRFMKEMNDNEKIYWISHWRKYGWCYVWENETPVSFPAYIKENDQEFVKRYGALL